MMEVDVTFVFDEVLSRHMERLFGSRQGIGGLQLGIGTIACLTLLADQPERGQPTEPDPSTATADRPEQPSKGESTTGGADQPDDAQPPAEGSTTATLESKLAELGFQDNEKVQSLIQEMRDKGYIIEDEHGRMTGGKPAVSMARLLERIFPRLPGKTLVAYFIQTVDEVLTGRKATEVALAHFDQTLKMQGVPLKQPKSERPSSAQGAETRPKEGAVHVFKEAQPILKSTTGFLPPQEGESGGVRIIGSSGDGFRYRLRDIQKPSPSPAEVPAESAQSLSTDRPQEAEPPSETGGDRDAIAESPAEAPAESQPVCTESPPEPPPEEQPAAIESQEPPAEGMAGAEGTDTTPGPEKESQGPEETADELIEKEIAGFQDELASLCPLCKEGNVREEKTETGKSYYKCTNKACNLVSWGRPHHVPCPVCNNPFLIEVSAEGGQVGLQCPRATCKYQATLSQDPGGGDSKTDAASRAAGPGTGKPRRRVIRRRVVRRRK